MVVMVMMWRDGRCVGADRCVCPRGEATCCRALCHQEWLDHVDLLQIHYGHMRDWEAVGRGQRRRGTGAPWKERLIMSHKGFSHLGLSTRVSIMDTQGQVVARWDSLSAHGSWVDAHGDIYLALGTRARVDKYVRQG